jgi:predicted transcriptional regulator
MIEQMSGKDIGHELKEMRINRKLSLRKAQKLSGVHYSRIKRIEDGSEVKLSDYQKLLESYSFCSCNENHFGCINISENCRGL